MTSTHVANAYDETVWVYHHSRNIAIKEVFKNVKDELVVGVGKPGAIPLDTVTMTPIEPGKYQSFERRNNWDRITVCPNKHSQEILSLPQNRSVLVKPDGSVGISYHKGMFQNVNNDIWKDFYGKDYRKYSNSIQVANAYIRPVWVYPHASSATISDCKGNIQGDFEVELGSRSKKAKMVSIGAGETLQLERNECITVRVKDGVVPKVKLPPTGGSVLVKPDGTVGLSSGGDIWKDMDGNDYSKYKKK